MNQEPVFVSYKDVLALITRLQDKYDMSAARILELVRGSNEEKDQWIQALCIAEILFDALHLIEGDKIVDIGLVPPNCIVTLKDKAAEGER